MADISLIVDVVGEEDMVAATRAAEKMRREYAQLDRAFNKGTITAQQYSRGIQQVDSKIDAFTASHRNLGAATKQLARDVQQSSKLMNQYGDVASRNTRNFKRFGAVGLQQVGYQVGDFAVQLQGGTNAAVAFGQQGSQLLGIFGPLGAILGAVLAVTTAFVAPMLDSAEAGGEMAEQFGLLGDQLKTIEPLLNSVRSAFVSLGEISLDFANVLLNNLDRVVIYAGTAAAVFGGKFVAGLVAARVATLTLAGAFAFLRGAIMRTGIGLLIVGAGELVYQFTRLVKGAGSFGEAFSLVGDVTKEVFSRIPEFWLVAKTRLVSDWVDFKASVLEVLGGIVDYVAGDWVNSVVGAFVGAKDAAVASWELLPAALTNIGARAVNGLIEKVGKGVSNLVSGPLAPLLRLAGINPAAAGLGAEALSTLRVDVPESPDVGSVVQEAFSNAMGRDYAGAFTSGITSQAEQFRKDAEIINNVANILAENLKRPIESLADLRQALADADEAGRDIDIRNWLGGLSAGVDEEGGAGGKSAAEEAADELEKLQNQAQSIADTIKTSMSDAFMSIVDGTKTAADAFKDMARSILKQLYDVLVVQQLVGSFNAQTGQGSGIVGAIMGVFQANGGVWNKGVQMYADGGVVSGATAFAHSGGLGVMGEAGPEAIMPLKRGKNGKLGVQVEGETQGNVTVEQHFHVHGNGDEYIMGKIQQAAPQLANYTQQQMLDQRRRGGVVKSTFG